jgi:glutathione S-transferase
MTDLTFWTNPRSRGAIVRWMLEEVGASCDTVGMAFGPALRSAKYLALNPMGKVPVIRHNGQIVTDRAATCACLAQAFPEAGPGPRPDKAGACWRWMFFGAGPPEAAVTNRALGLTPPPDRRGMVAHGELDTAVGALEGRVAQSPFPAAERFTAADVHTGSPIGLGLMFGTVPDRPAVRAHWGRISARPAHARAAAPDAALMTGEPS